MEYIVETEQPTRLDIWLAGKLGQSRSQIQKLIKSGAVLVNGKAKTAHFIINHGDVVQLSSSSPTLIGDPETNKKTKRSFGFPFGFLDSRLPPRLASGETGRGNDNGGSRIDYTLNPKPYTLIYESHDYLIVEKPIGMVVHPDAKHKGNTLLDFLLETYPEIKNVGNPERPGIVHRLDKEVSGLLVVARNQQFYDHMKQQFDARGISKEYIALVFGEIKNKTGTISFKLVRSKNQEKYIGLPPTSDDLDAKDAETHYEVIVANQHYSLLKLFPKTGRTHQLRVHMHTFGHPIVGDRLYDLPHWRHLNRKFSRVMLHARRIRFQDPAGESVQYESDVPNEMATMIEDIFHVKDF